MSNLITLGLKLWPLVVGVCGAVWFAAHGDPEAAWKAIAAIILGAGATATNEYFHRAEPSK